MSILITERLRKSFGKDPTKSVNAVRSIDLTVQQGTIFGFLGPNGAGKTTTMRMLTTLLEPTSGKATIAGYDLIKQPNKVRENIGYVSQTGGLDTNSTGRENLLLQARLYGMSKADAIKRSQKLITNLDLDSFIDRLAITYSGGQRRRVDLALGMIHKPKLLFLDEPTLGLDPQSRAQLWQEMRSLQAHGTTIFFTTHYLDEANILCDNLAIINKGVIVTQGTPKELKQQITSDVINLELSSSSDLVQAQELLHVQPFIQNIHHEHEKIKLRVELAAEVLPHIIRLLDSAGISLQSITLDRPTLDDVFLQVAGNFPKNCEGTLS